MLLRHAVPLVIATAVMLVLGVGAPALASPSGPRPGSSSATRSTPAPCPNAVAPGPAVDSSEAPRPGGAPPPPLPAPAIPAGGPAMASCGDVVPPGAPPAPRVGVESYVVADLDSGAVLAVRNPHARLRPASLMKTLTGLLVARRLDMSAPIVGTAEDADQDGTRVGIGPGGQYTVGSMLHAMLMASGNDATHALSTKLTGSDDRTVALMNETARALGALDTRTASPSGLDGPGMVTSAYDLASIFRVAMREPAFAQATGTRTIVLPGYEGKPPIPVSNDNKLVGSPGYIGGKTGFTDDARHTYIAAANRGGHRLVVVLMRGEQHPVPMYRQGAALLDYGFAHAGGPGIGTLADGPLPGDAPAGTDGGTPGSGASAAAPGLGGGGSSTVWTVALVIVIVAAVGLVLLGIRRRDRR